MKRFVVDLTTGRMVEEKGASTTADAHGFFDDCPLCQEAKARGELPVALSGDDLERALAELGVPAPAPRRRWGGRRRGERWRR